MFVFKKIVFTGGGHDEELFLKPKKNIFTTHHLFQFGLQIQYAQCSELITALCFSVTQVAEEQNC